MRWRAACGLLRHFGGISGAERDAASDTWLMVSDGKSEEAPARFYTLRLRIDEHGIRPIEPLAVTELLQPDGTRYPGLAEARGRPGAVVPDIEALRIDPQDGSVLYSSEGDRRLVLDPFVRRADRDGRFLGELALPQRLRMHRDEGRGPRHNLSLEGLAFTPDAQAPWIAMEAPLYEDGVGEILAIGARGGRVPFPLPCPAVRSGFLAGERRGRHGFAGRCRPARRHQASAAGAERGRAGRDRQLLAAPAQPVHRAGGAAALSKRSDDWGAILDANNSH